MKKKILVAVLVLVALVADSGPMSASGQSAVQSSESSYINAPYISPSPGEIPIIAMGPYFENNGPTHQDFIDIRDCGFNLAMLTTSVNGFNKTFDVIDGTGVKLIIHNPDMLDPAYRQKFVDRYINNENLAAWDLYDEPRFKEVDKIAAAYREMRKLDPSRLIFFNLAGGTAEIFAGPYRHYPAYLNFIQEKFHPGVWSYDYYPITLDSRGERTVGRYFYYDLECLSRQSLLTSRPFWYYVLGQEFIENGVTWPLPNESEIRMQMFSALGYGAQGFSYWSYCVRHDVAGSDVVHTTALVGRDGKKTSAWYAAKQVNSEIKRFNNIFLGSKPLMVRHTGSDMPMGAIRIELPYGPLKSFTSEASGVQVSLLVNGGKKYLLIVSHDILKKQRVSFDLLDDFSLTEITSADGDNRKIVSPALLRERSVSRTLNPGGYLLFSWEES